jgi:limonene 1,2-monooxygenase
VTTNHIDFGLFMPSWHPLGENPTRALHRDLETIQYAESLGFTEAWVGEHHSEGHEIIGPHEIFIAAAIERTSRIRIGTGVTTLPYHHPLHVAERAVLLDHLSYGRTMLGIGPGSLPSDASMIGVPWKDTRKRMRESWSAVHHLLTSDEPLTMETDWFTLNEAALQLKPYSRPTMEFAVTAMESPNGPSLAGQYGTSLISLSTTSATGYAALGSHWGVVEEQAAAHGQTVDRANWGVTVQMHIAETREQARDDVARNIVKYAEFANTVSQRPPGALAPGPDGVPLSVNQLVDAFNGFGTFVIGTPDDAIEVIDNITKMTGGFGRLLVWGGSHWTSQEASFRSLELLSRQVMPVFQGSSAPQFRAVDHVKATRDKAINDQRASVEAATAGYQAPSSTEALHAR